MPIYRDFYVEQLRADGWSVPLGFEAEPWTFEHLRGLGGFAWAHPNRPWLKLFWGEDALFPMRLGAPEDRRGSALLQELERSYGHLIHEVDLCWMPYADLCVDCWDTDRLILRKQFPARYAILFGNGQQPFPRAELLAVRQSDLELRGLEDGWLTTEPLDNTVGERRFRLGEIPGHYQVEVTWTATIAEFIGEPQARVFQELGRYGPDEELRILSGRG